VVKRDCEELGAGSAGSSSSLWPGGRADVASRGMAVTDATHFSQNTLRVVAFGASN
jgi:hypothetical protein